MHNSIINVSSNIPTTVPMEFVNCVKKYISKLNITFFPHLLFLPLDIEKYKQGKKLSKSFQMYVVLKLSIIKFELNVSYYVIKKIDKNK